MNSSNPNHCYAPLASMAGATFPPEAAPLTHRQPQQQMWDYWDHTNAVAGATLAAAHPAFLSAPYIEYPQPPPILPPANFPFYIDQGHPMVKTEDAAAVAAGRIGLNLGYRTYFSSGDAAAIDRLFRRSRGLFPAAHPVPHCQAEGCKADLSGAKHYHRRHKVCEFHSKATVVVAAGLQQRFCQQCSRFHVLSEFDEAKRSCRKRLADHNRRRRKPQQSNGQDQSGEEANESNEMESKGGTSNSGSSSTGRGAAATATAMGGGTSSSSGRMRMVGGESSTVVTQLRKSPALSLGGGSGSGTADLPYPTLLVNPQSPPAQHHHHHRQQQCYHHHMSPAFFPTTRQSPPFNEGASSSHQLSQGLSELDFM